MYFLSPLLEPPPQTNTYSPFCKQTNSPFQMLVNITLFALFAGRWLDGTWNVRMFIVFVFIVNLGASLLSFAVIWAIFQLFLPDSNVCTNVTSVSPTSPLLLEWLRFLLSIVLLLLSIVQLLLLSIDCAAAVWLLLLFIVLCLIIVYNFLIHRLPMCHYMGCAHLLLVSV